MSSVVAKTAAAQCGAGVQQEQKLTVASSSSSKSNGSSSQNNAAASKTPQLRPRLVQQTRSISSNPLLDGNRSSCKPLIPKSRIVKATHSSHALISKRNQYGATASTTGSSSFASKGMCTYYCKTFTFCTCSKLTQCNDFQFDGFFAD